MKKIVFAAPGISPPFTEGRKIYVSELSEALISRGLDVELITNSPEQKGLGALLQVLKMLREQCRRPELIEAIVIFPYGTFDGLRGLANRWFLRRAIAIASRASARYMPAFYSGAGISIESLDKNYSPALAMGRSMRGLQCIHLGTSRHIKPWQPRRERIRDILFLCGYQSPNHAALRNVLHERGLLDLLRAGSEIEKSKISLTIAIPFLREAKMRKHLLKIIKNTCPSLKIELRDAVDATDIFSNYDAFVFPYHTDHAIFIPTSLLEAMSAGIPTIAADHAMYRSLTKYQGQDRCRLYPPGDTSALADSITRTDADYHHAIQLGRDTASAIRSEWNIEASADEIISALKQSK